MDGLANLTANFGLKPLKVLDDKVQKFQPKSITLVSYCYSQEQTNKIKYSIVHSTIEIFPVLDDCRQLALVDVVAAVGMMCIWWYSKLSRNVLICRGPWSNCIISCNDHWCEENTICSKSFIKIFLLHKVTTGLSHCMNYVGALWYICTSTLHLL